MTVTLQTADHSQADRPRGRVVSLRSSVVDVWFSGHIPELNTQLEVPGGTPIILILEVMTQVDDHTVRSVALTPTAGLARGSEVINTGHPIQVPVGARLLGRVFDVFGRAIDDQEPLAGGSGDQSTKVRPPLPASQPGLKF